MQFRAAVFDLDGLMFDTEALFYRVSSEMLAARGKSFTPEIMRAMLGRRSIEAGAAIRTLAGLEEPAEVLLAEVRSRFYELADRNVSPNPGLLALLDHLRQRAVPLAVATSSRRAYADALLSRHGVRDRFEFVLASEDVTSGKPDPEIYVKASRRFGIETGAMLVLEDSPAGVGAARAAGAFVVAVPHVHSPADSLGEADLIISRLDEPALLHLIHRVVATLPPRDAAS
jgi:HAD superfamily hydrolase (TIGR01509 family)